MNTTTKKSGVQTLCVPIALFFLFSFLGWGMEKLWFLFAYGENADRGFLTLPLCPIYGGSLLTIRALFGLPVKDGERYPHNLVRLLLYAFAASLVATAAELLTATFFDRAFGVRLWSYRGYPYEWRGYICLPMSVAWGALIVAAMGLIWTPLEKALGRAPTRVLVSLDALLVVAAALDFTINLVLLF
ncbi:MAG: hypothetical protein ACI4NG_06150 [Candidatus Gallimonas sp.]